MFRPSNALLRLSFKLALFVCATLSPFIDSAGHAKAGEFCGRCRKTVSPEMVTAAEEFDETERLAHLKSHWGTAPGVLPLFQDVEWGNIIFCVLHLYLRCTGKLIERLIVPLIKTEVTAQRVIELLTKHSVCFHHVSDAKAEINKNAHRENFAHHSWIGRDCDALLEHVAEVLDIVFEGKADQTTKAQYLSIFDTFAEAYHALTHIDDSPTVELEPQVVELQAKIDVFAELFQKHLSGDSAGIYFHILVAHAANQTRRHGCLTKYSAQALEHFHSRLKLVSRICGRPATATRDALRIHLISNLMSSKHTDDALKIRQARDGENDGMGVGE